MLEYLQGIFYFIQGGEYKCITQEYFMLVYLQGIFYCIYASISTGYAILSIVLSISVYLKDTLCQYICRLYSIISTQRAEYKCISQGYSMLVYLQGIFYYIQGGEYKYISQGYSMLVYLQGIFYYIQGGEYNCISQGYSMLVLQVIFYYIYASISTGYAILSIVLSISVYLKDTLCQYI